MEAKEMYEEFQCYTHIDEVIISFKRDIRGRRYDFVRFFYVKDEDLLAVKLNNIFIDRKKMFVNVLRFQRKQHVKPGEARRRKDWGKQLMFHEKKPRFINESSRSIRGHFYADVLKPKVYPFEYNTRCKVKF
ncbi:unnamed protein product [Lathyrus sativus]|nr:unnamed protein product [Lathyrus sativus]